MRIILELIRIIGLIFISGGLLWIVLNNIYHAFGFHLENNNQYILLFLLVTFIFVFIIYRNYLQFSGWYPKPKGKRLPKKILVALIIFELIILIIIIPLLSILDINQ